MGHTMKLTIGLQFLWLVVSLQALAMDEHDAILDLARQTIEKSRYATFVTVDDKGQPRTRIVDPFIPDDEFVIYVATKPNTRKVTQIEDHTAVTLFYYDAEGRNYVSVMGQAELLRDNATKRQMRREADSDKIYPNFPNDYLLIKIYPRRVEGLLPGYRGDPDDWRPIGVDFLGEK